MWLVAFAFLALPLLAACDDSPTKPAPERAEWSSDVRLTFDPGASQLSFNFAWSVAADAAGRVHAVWYDRRGAASQIFYRRSDDGGATWEPERRLSMSAVGAEHPAVAASGSHVYVVWHEFHPGHGPDIHFRHSGDGGLTWDPEVPLTSRGTSAHASVATAGAAVQVVWGDARDGNAEIYTRGSADAGTTWTAEQRLSDAPYESWVPTVARAGDDVYVAWVDYRDANEEEYFRRSSDGGLTWGPITRLTDDAADSWAPSLAAPGGAVHVVWFDRRDAGVSDADIENVLDRAMALLGLPVEPAPPRDPAVYYLPPFTQRVQEKLAKIRAAAPGWVEGGGDPARLEALLKEFERAMEEWGSGWEIYYKRSGDGGSTWGPDTRLTTAPRPSARPSIAASGSELHVVWFDFRDGNAEVYYKRSPDGGASWEPDTRLTFATGDSQHPTVAATDDAVHVLWFDDRDGNPEIYNKRKKGGG